MKADTTLHPLVEQILRSGKVLADDGQTFEAHSYISRDECELLYRQVAATRATVAIEVGMAFGISTLCLCDALSRNTLSNIGKRPHLVVIDPHQQPNTETATHPSWQGLGLQQVRSAGFDDLVEFHGRTSQAALPELAAKGYRVQFAFIDGWHLFDHTLIDFFYVDQMMEIGGVIVFDDVGWPAINAVVRFVLANRDYELVEAEALEMPRTAMVSRGKSFVKRLLRPLASTDKALAERQLFRKLGSATSAESTLSVCRAVGVRKVAPDTRPGDHYCPF
jgi:predicted O-methyltransferase YrrM